jgi:uncharacterized membrane protein
MKFDPLTPSHSMYLNFQAFVFSIEFRILTNFNFVFLQAWMGPRGLFSSVFVLLLSFFIYSSIFTELEEREEEGSKNNETRKMNLAKKIASNVIKAAPSGPVCQNSDTYLLAHSSVFIMFMIFLIKLATKVVLICQLH